MVLAPLAFCSKRRRSLIWFLAFLGFFALSWSLNIVGFVHILRLPGLNMMSHNRLVFAASFAFLALAAAGLEVLWSGELCWQKWFRYPVIITAALGLWCLFRLVLPPNEITYELPRRLFENGKDSWLRKMSDVPTVHATFRTTYLAGLVSACVALGGWWLIRHRNNHVALKLSVVGPLLVADMLWFVHGRTVQCDPDLYYPRIPALQQIADAPWGRIIGSHCLFPSLATAANLYDVRGYDGADPARFVELVLLSTKERGFVRSYAAIQFLRPESTLVGDSDIRVPPVLDLLGVRYVIFRGSPPAGFKPKFQSPDYWVVENKSALPHAFVPQTVERVNDSKERLNKLGSSDFDPRKVAYVETAVSLPALCKGTAEVTGAIPTSILVQAKMETPGLLVLSDRWDPGWRAYVNGKGRPIEVVNHALRGVLLPAGQATVEFRYESATRALGLRLSYGAVAVIVLWVLGVLLWQRRFRG
jgi:hypothetical protein